MILLTSMLRRLPHLTHKEFTAYHRGHHAPLFASTPAAKKYVRRYTVEHPKATRTPGLPASSFDAIVRMEFDSLADLAKMFTSRSYFEVIRPDEKRFFDFKTSEFFLSEEQVMIGEGAPESLPFTVPTMEALASEPVEYRAIEPRRWRPPVAATGKPSAMQNFRLFNTDGFGTEDVAVRQDGQVVTGLADGRIIAVNPTSGECTTLANTSGRPLGIEVHPKGGYVVCDKEKGLLFISEQGEVKSLVSEFQGGPIKFANNAAVAKDGTIYFSDSSQRFGLADWRGDVIEHCPTGRLYKRAPDGKVDLLVDNLAFANGVALAPDESFVVVAQTCEYDMKRVDLKGPNKGRVSSFGCSLPGFPDNISTGEDGNLWVTIVAPRVSLVDFFLPKHPFWRKLIWRIPEHLQPQGDTAFYVIAFSPEGKQVHNFFCRHPAFGNATGARQVGSQVWVGSIRHAAIARFDLPGTDTVG